MDPKLERADLIPTKIQIFSVPYKNLGFSKCDIGDEGTNDPRCDHIPDRE
jgi:hypothetical protein